MEFKEFLFGLGVVFSIITAAIIFILGCAIIFVTADYYLSESYCTAYVDNKEVYTGRCHFLEIDSIGENGNTLSQTCEKYKREVRNCYRSQIDDYFYEVLRWCLNNEYIN